MNSATTIALAIAITIAACLLVLFGGGMYSGTMMSGGMMGDGSWNGVSWMWLPALLIVVIGGVLVSLILGRK